MTRKECYAYIKKNNLGKECSKTLGYTWTNAKTNILESYINTVEGCKGAVPESNVPNVNTLYSDAVYAIAALIVSFDDNKKLKKDIDNAVNTIKKSISE